MLNIVIPNSKATLERQIKALKGLIRTDNPKDAQIHQSALQQLQRVYEAL